MKRKKSEAVMERKIDKVINYEKPLKETSAERRHRLRRELQERHNGADDFDRYRMKRMDLPREHHQRKVVERERAVSPDNTLREVVGTMPNIQLTRTQSNEPVYTDDQLM